MDRNKMFSPVQLTQEEFNKIPIKLKNQFDLTLKDGILYERNQYTGTPTYMYWIYYKHFIIDNDMTPLAFG